MTDFVSDAALIERFARTREQDAFAALVHRHGPRVLAACRRILRDQHEAEDVFQATFLVLARKASADIAWRDSVGGWLCAVALRLARNVRSGQARKRRRETTFAGAAHHDAGCDVYRVPDACHPQADPFVGVALGELRQVLDDELRRLPEKYRAPLVLCYLEGKTNEEAARQLGWPSGSMSRRLERARGLLRPRLARRGFALPLVIVCAGLALVVAWNGSRQTRNALAIRAAMAPLKARNSGADGAEAILTRFIRNAQQPTDWNQLAEVARQSALVAERIKGLGPPRKSPGWHGLNAEMGTAARSLGAALQNDDEEAAREAARALKAACVKCHVAFRD